MKASKFLSLFLCIVMIMPMTAINTYAEITLQADPNTGAFNFGIDTNPEEDPNANYLQKECKEDGSVVYKVVWEDGADIGAAINEPAIDTGNDIFIDGGHFAYFENNGNDDKFTGPKYTWGGYKPEGVKVEGAIYPRGSSVGSTEPDMHGAFGVVMPFTGRVSLVAGKGGSTTGETNLYARVGYDGAEMLLGDINAMTDDNGEYVNSSFSFNVYPLDTVIAEGTRVFFYGSGASNNRILLSQVIITPAGAGETPAPHVTVAPDFTSKVVPAVQVGKEEDPDSVTSSDGKLIVDPLPAGTDKNGTAQTWAAKNGLISAGNNATGPDFVKASVDQAPTQGSAIKINVTEPGMVKVVTEIGAPFSSGDNRHAYVLKFPAGQTYGGEQLLDFENATGVKYTDDENINFSAEPGFDYYVYVDGSKAGFGTVTFTPDTAVPEQPTRIPVTEPTQTPARPTKAPTIHHVFNFGMDTDPAVDLNANYLVREDKKDGSVVYKVVYEDGTDTGEALNEPAIDTDADIFIDGGHFAYFENWGSDDKFTGPRNTTDGYKPDGVKIEGAIYSRGSSVGASEADVHGAFGVVMPFTGRVSLVAGKGGTTTGETNLYARIGYDGAETLLGDINAMTDDQGEPVTAPFSFNIYPLDTVIEEGTPVFLYGYGASNNRILLSQVIITPAGAGETPAPQVTAAPGQSTEPPVGGIPADKLWKLNDKAVQDALAAYKTDDTAPVENVDGAVVGPGYTYDTGRSVWYTHTNGRQYNFTGSLRGGSGSTDKLYVSIIPEPCACTVTVVFDGHGSAGRIQNIAYDADGDGMPEVVSSKASDAGATAVTYDMTAAQAASGKPVYTYGGGSNKNLYAIFIEYYEETPDKKLTGNIYNQTGRDFSGKNIVFTNDENPTETYSVPYDESGYNIRLPKGKTFTATIEGECDVCTTIESQHIEIWQNKYDQEMDLTFVLIADAEVSGKVSTISSHDLLTPVYDYDEAIGAKLTFTKQGETEPYATADVAADGTYKATLMSNETYDITLETAEGQSYSLSPLSGSYQFLAGDQAPFKNILLMKDGPASLEYKDTLTVGEDKEYKSISEALAAVRLMSREAGQVVNIVIDPGTYEEQLYVNMDDIALKAANPDDRPLITWYYGIGYVYDSAAPQTNAGDPESGEGKSYQGWYSADYAVAKTSQWTVNNWGSTIRTLNRGFYMENINAQSSFNLYITQKELDDHVTPGGGDAKVGVFRDDLDTAVNNRTYNERAAAIFAGGSQIELYKCSFVSSQDTFGTGAKSMYVKDCMISGNTDYICGGDNCYFENCELRWQGMSDTDNGGYITACKNSAETDLGYYFKNCTITKNPAEGMQAGKGGNWGRPWGGKGKTVTIFDNTTIGDGVNKPTGWTSMSSSKPSDAIYYVVNGVYKASDPTTDITTTFDNPNGTYDANDYTLPTPEQYFGEWTPINYTKTERPTSTPGHHATEPPTTDAPATLVPATATPTIPPTAAPTSTPTAIPTALPTDTPEPTKVPAVLNGIRIKSMPKNLTVTEGTALNIDGLIVEGIYSDGTFGEITDYTLSGFDPSKLGMQSVTVEHNGFTANFMVYVEAKKLTGIEITKKPDKRSYIQGEALDTSGMIVTALYNNDTSEEIKDYTVSGYDPNYAGSQTISVSYGGFSAAFTVTVSAKEQTSGTAETPKISISSFIGGKTVTLTCATEGAAIYYTDDGSAPSEKSEPYTEPITLTETKTIKAIAVKSGAENSKIASGKITVAKTEKPSASHNAGQLETGTVITLKSPTSGAMIYYTTDGSEPSVESKRYSGGIAITSNVTIKAIAVKSGNTNSDVFEISYTVPEIEKGSASVSLGSVTGAAGDNISVPVYIFTEEKITDYRLTINYDADKFEYQSVTPAEGAEASDLFTSAGDGKVTVLYSGAAIESGEMCGINLKAIESDEDGEYPISLDKENIKVETESGIGLEINVTDGAITLEGSINSNLDKVKPEAVLTDSNGNDITDSEKVKGEVTANVTLENTEESESAEPVLVNIIMAVYDRNGCLVNMSIMDADLSDLNYVFTSSIDIPDGVEVGNIKLMVWNGLSDMSPMSAASEIL